MALACGKSSFVGLLKVLLTFFFFFKASFSLPIALHYTTNFFFSEDMKREMVAKNKMYLRSMHFIKSIFYN